MYLSGVSGKVEGLIYVQKDVELRRYGVGSLALTSWECLRRRRFWKGLQRRGRMQLMFLPCTHKLIIQPRR